MCSHQSTNPRARLRSRWRSRGFVPRGRMQASRCCLGVRNLFPLLQRKAPACSLHIPRYAGLAHARIAIDGTLLTQRFFYTDDDTQARHLVGLARVIRALHEVGAVPILVYDHLTARLPQKHAEQLRRRAARTLGEYRLALETKRRVRSAALHAAVRAYERMGRDEQGEVSMHFAALGRGAHTPLEPQAHASAAHLAQLYHAHKAETAAHAESALKESSVQARVRVAEDRIYEALAVQRVDANGRLLTTALPVDVPATHTAAWVCTQSAQLHTSYARSARSVTPALYAQCIELCRRMHVPVFVTGDATPDGGAALHEAEAFASALVQHGYADMVASEDSDVLLYHVPLLRGLSGTSPSCELVDAGRMRAALFPEAADDRVRRAKLLQFALLCGTDFNRTVPGLGPVLAHKYIGLYGDVRGVLRNEPKYKPPQGLSVDAYVDELQHALAVLQHPPAVDAAAHAASLARSAPSAHTAPWSSFLGTPPTPTPPPPAYDLESVDAFIAAHQRKPPPRILPDATEAWVAMETRT